MTQEETMLDMDFNWDEPLVTDAGSLEGKRQFAKVRMLPVPVIPFQKGASFTLPGVHDSYKSKDSSEPILKSFGGMKQGKTSEKHTIYVLVAEKTTKEGKPYQAVKWFKSWPEKGRKNIWAELQFPSIKGFDSANRARFLGQGIYAGFDEVPAGEKATIDGQEQELKYWTNFTIFADEAAMKAAETAFFAQFADNGSVANLDLTNIPKGWIKGDAVKDAASVQTLYQQIKKQYDEGKAPMEIAKKLSIVSKAEGTPMPNKDGQPVNVAELFSAALDMPSAMFESELV